MIKASGASRGSRENIKRTKKDSAELNLEFKGGMVARPGTSATALFPWGQFGAKTNTRERGQENRQRKLRIYVKK